jgi:hypothetical protein
LHCRKQADCDQGSIFQGKHSRSIANHRTL